MRRSINTARMIEMDGALHLIQGDALCAVADVSAVPGEKWLVTDFGEAIARRMTVEGPPQYAEVLVRRKLQESGEFDEPVQILTHWKRRRGRNITDLFFTAVPSRIAAYYFEELRRKPDLTLIVPMYAVLWDMIQRRHEKDPTAVVLRHGRFAEVLVGTRERVLFANRCVAFDTHQEQLAALWETVRADLEAVERENRVTIGRVTGLTWLEADEALIWPESWRRRYEAGPQMAFELDGQSRLLSWPAAYARAPFGASASPWIDKLLAATRRWAPAVNALLLAAVAASGLAWGAARNRTADLDAELSALQHELRKLSIALPQATDMAAFGRALEFVNTLDQKQRRLSAPQFLADLDRAGFSGLRVTRLSVDSSTEPTRVELFAEIQAPFEQAQAGYQAMLSTLGRQGYRIDENRFETQISKSQVVLKLSR